MIRKILDFSIRERLVVVVGIVVVFAYGWYATQTVPLDAIPNVGENQVIVLVQWMGRSPKDMEDQITYPLSVALQAVPGAKSVRSVDRRVGVSMVLSMTDPSPCWLSRTTSRVSSSAARTRTGSP